MAKFRFIVTHTHISKTISVWDASTSSIVRKDQLRDAIDAVLNELIPDNICDMPDLHNDLPKQVFLKVQKENGQIYEVGIYKEKGGDK